MPTEKAHGFQIAKMCESFARAGVDVELVVPTRANKITEDAYSYFGIAPVFKITYIRIPDITTFKIGYYIHQLVFAIKAGLYAAQSDSDVVYSRDVLPLQFVMRTKKIILEVHNVPERFVWLYRLALHKIYRVISTNFWKKTFLVEQCNFNAKKIFVFPNGIDISRPRLSMGRDALCSELGLNSEFKYVVYTGHLYEWKGAQILAEASALLPENTRTIFVGGTSADVKKFTARFRSDRIIMIPHQPHDKVSDYLAIADVLILPNIPISRESIYTTSPMKLFEYMAAGRPIVASDLPSIREILDESSAILIKPGDVDALAHGINQVLNDPLSGSVRAGIAYERVKQYSWQNRAQKILDFIKS